jgi:predicted nucleic acid-binding protein
MSGANTVFLDTNVLVYARDRNEPVTGTPAQAFLTALFQAGQPLVSVQVLSEFFWAVTRKLKAPLSLDEATAESKRLIVLTTVVPVTPVLFERALEIVASHQLSLWDAQIIAAASSHGAMHVLSEDLQHRQTLEGLIILNPFAPDFDEKEILQTS